MRRPEPLPPELRGIGSSRQEALAPGVAEHRLRGAGLTSPVGRGVRVPDGCPAPLLGAARALTRRCPGTVISHRSAALLHRLRAPSRWQRSSELWLTRADSSRALRRPGVVCRRGRLGPHEVVRVHGATATSPVRTFLDVCAELTVTEAVVLADGLINAHRHGIRRVVAAVC